MKKQRNTGRALAAAIAAALVAPATARAATSVHYSFDQAVVNSGPGGSDFADTSANGLHSNINNETLVSASAAGVFGSGVSFNNTSGAYVTTPDVNGWQNSGFTIASWINPADTGVNTIFGDWASPHAFRLWVDGGQLKFQSRRSSGTIDIFNGSPQGAVVSDGSVFSHVAVSVERIDANSSTATFYVNGVVTATVNSSAFGLQTVDMINNARNYHIGLKADGAAEAFNGSLDELWVYNTALTQTQVTNLRNTNDIGAVTHTASKSGTAFGVSGTDLLQTAFGSVTAVNLEDNGAEPILRNGAFDTGLGATERATAGAGRFVEYAFDLSQNPIGFDITSIETFAQWVAGSGGRSAQAYEVQVSFWDDPTAFFTLLNNADWTADIFPTDGLFTKVVHDGAGDGVLSNGIIDATGVARIRFNFLNGAPLGVNMYREIDIFGFATAPAPAALPGGLALLTLAGMRRRRR